MNTFISNISDNSEPYVKVSEAELRSIDEGLEEAKKGIFISHIYFDSLYCLPKDFNEVAEGNFKSFIPGKEEI